MKSKRVVVVKLNKLGDSLAFLPTLAGIRRQWKDAQITLVTTRAASEIYSGLGLADSIHITEVAHVRTLAGFTRLLRRFKRERFDIAVASSDTSSFVALLFFLARIPRRIGFSNPKLSFLYNENIPVDTSLTHRELNSLILKKLGIAHEPHHGAVEIPGAEKEAVSRLLLEAGVGEDERFAVLHCGSKSLGQGKLWPPEMFAQIVNFLHSEYAMKTILIGEKHENDYADRLAATNDRSHFIDFAGRLSVKGMLYLVSRAGLFMGHPSGPLQAAYLMGTPSVSLWGASTFADWRPSRDNEKHICLRADLDCLGCEQDPCKQASYLCMDLISVPMVKQAVSLLLERCIECGRK